MCYSLHITVDMCINCVIAVTTMYEDVARKLEKLWKIKDIGRESKVTIYITVVSIVINAEINVKLTAVSTL